MRTNPPGNPNDQSQPSYPNSREERRAARQMQRAQRYGAGGSWVGGAILILLGIIFLLQNFGAFKTENWWALFILLPAIGSLGGAWNIYQTNGGQLNGAVLGSLIAGLFFLGLTFALFFSLDLTWIGPIALIVFGVGLLLVGLLRMNTR